MAYPMYPFHSNTERGVSSLRWSLLLTFTMEILAVVILIPVGYYMMQSSGSSTDYLTIIPLLLTVILLGVVAMIFFLSGLARLHAGRDEYETAHARNAETVVVFTVIAFVVGISALTFGGPFGVLFGRSDEIGYAVTGALSVVRGLFVGLAFAFAVRALVKPEEAPVGTFAMIALAVGPAVGAGVSIVLLSGVSVSSGLRQPRGHRRRGRDRPRRVRPVLPPVHDPLEPPPVRGDAPEVPPAGPDDAVLPATVPRVRDAVLPAVPRPAGPVPGARAPALPAADAPAAAAAPRAGVRGYSHSIVAGGLFETS